MSERKFLQLTSRILKLSCLPYAFVRWKWPLNMNKMVSETLSYALNHLQEPSSQEDLWGPDATVAMTGWTCWEKAHTTTISILGYIWVVSWSQVDDGCSHKKIERCIWGQKEQYELDRPQKQFGTVCQDLETHRLFLHNSSSEESSLRKWYSTEIYEWGCLFCIFIYIPHRDLD